MLVVDAGAMTRVLLRTPGANRAWQALESAAGDLHAAELFDVEVLSVLRKLVLRGALTDERASEAVADLQEFGILRHSHAELLNRAWLRLVAYSTTRRSHAVQRAAYPEGDSNPHVLTDSRF